jgi:bifunctional DNA-binding transcriptional regulator/antitoxin component of YhaV-PrlF toxin-antitoxin module
VALEDLIRFQFKRVNPFQGLVLDADTWKDEQDYHRNQQRLHTLAFHGIGIVEGLEVKANQPPDFSLIISPGMAVDTEGNAIVVPKSQRYNLGSKEKGQVYLIVQYREVPTAPASPSEEGQTTRILEAYRIREVTRLPDEPYLELARLDFDPSKNNITDARVPSNPTVNEIDLRFRQSAKAPLLDASEIALHPHPPREIAPQEKVILGHMALGEASPDLHSSGLMKLARQVGFQTEYQAAVEECILDETITHHTLLYLTGNGPFTISAKKQAILNSFVQSGGTIFAESCAEQQEAGVKEFGLAFNRLAEQLGENWS